jgi:hypothetical protein
MKAIAGSKSTPNKRRFYPYTDWEDWQNGMYAGRANDVLSTQCAELLADQPRFAAASTDCVRKWRVSAAMNLAGMDGNRRAWIGQAACCFALGANEETTRRAWAIMSDEDRHAANLTADKVIQEYEQCQNEQLVLMF